MDWSVQVKQNLLLYHCGDKASEPMYIKRHWSNLDDIIFAKNRTQEDKKYLSDMLQLQWAISMTKYDYDDTNWLNLYRMIESC